MMWSHRDSNVAGVIATLEKTLEMTTNGEGVTDEVVDYTVVRLFADLNAPQAPHKRGLDRWAERSMEMRQKRRDVF